MAKRLLPPDWHVTKDNGDPATDAVLTIYLAGTTTLTAAYADSGLLTSLGSTVNCDSTGYPATGGNDTALWGSDTISYDIKVTATGYNGGAAKTLSYVAVADTSTASSATSVSVFNAVKNGAFDIWSNGTSFSNISGAGVGAETADGWYLQQPGTASNAVSQQAGPAVGAGAAGARYALRAGRPAASASTNAIRLWTTMSPETAYRLRGQALTLRATILAGANFSASALTINLATGTTEAESGDNIAAGGWGGQANPINQAQAITTTTTRYEYTATLGSTIKECGLEFSYTPTGVAGANDWFEVCDVELKLSTEDAGFEALPATIEFVRTKMTSGGQLVLATTFTDPNADRIFGWDDSASSFIGFTLGGALSSSGTAINVTAADILTQLLTVDGTGSGLDADLLDGHDTSYFLAASSYTAADVLAKLVTVDGSGSGLDADTLDGHDTGYFQPAHANLTALAGQIWAADQISYQTGAGAVANLAFPSASRTQIAAGLGTAAVVNDGTSGATYGKLNANKTDSGANVFNATNTFSGALLSTGGFRIDTPTNGVTLQTYSDTASEITFDVYQTGAGATKYNLYLMKYGGVLKVGGSAPVFASRPTFAGNTALDTANGAALAGATFTGAIQVTTIEVGNASDTTLARASAGKVSVEGVTLVDLGSATQTFTGDLVGANVAPSSTRSLGFRRFSAASITTGTPIASDSGHTIYATGGVTVPNAVFSAEDNYGIMAGGSSRAITQGAGCTLTNGNTGVTGNQTLAANGFATVIHTSASAATIYGNV